MAKKIRTEIVIETRQLILLKRVQSVAVNYCAECGSEMLKPETAVFFLQISTREIYRRVETGGIHFAEKPDGSLLVCFRSVMKI